jgi:hypothetical protein
MDDQRSVNNSRLAKPSTGKGGAAVRWSSHVHSFLLILTALPLASCGLVTPDIQEFWGTSGDAAAKESAIAFQARCELQKAARILVKKDIKFASAQGRQLKWLDSTWAADVLFVFTVDEKSALSPSVAFNRVFPNAVNTFPGKGTVTTGQSASTALAAGVSSEGYRQDKLHLFYQLSDLVGDEKKLPSLEKIEAVSCVPPPTNAVIFAESDLKISDWLISALDLQLTGQAQYQTPDAFATGGVLSHEVRFDIVTSGSVNPTWKLVLVSADTGSNPLFSASRDRTQDLTVTLGPGKNGQLSTNQGKNSAFTSEFNATTKGATSTP